MIKANKKQFILLGVIVAAVIGAIAMFSYLATRQSFGNSILKTKDTLKIGIRGDVVGFGQISEDGELIGFDREFIDELLLRLLPGEEKLYEYIPTTSQDAGANIKYGITNLNLGQLIEGTAKTKGFALTKPYYADNVVAVVQGSSKLDKLSNMDGGKLGILVSSISEDEAEKHLENINPKYELLRYSDYESALTDLEAGRTHAVLMPYAIARQFETVGFRILAEPLYQVGYSVMLPTGQTVVATEMNRIIDEMTQDGTLDALKLKWGLAGVGN